MTQSSAGAPGPPARLRIRASARASARASLDGGAGRWPLATWALGVGGALLLAVPGRRFGVDVQGCSDWPAHTTTALYFLVYLVGLGCLTLCWGRCLQQARAGRLRQRGVVLLGLSVHAAALFSTPFLSNDPLFYSAIGRAMATFHGSPYIQLKLVLPPGDPFLTILPERWAYGVSPYFPGFNAVARGVAELAGDSLRLHLRLYQGLGLLSLLLTALFTAAAASTLARTSSSRATESPDRPEPADPSAVAAQAAALVLLCPLAVIEGTVNAHNDTLLALAVALYALCVARGRLGLAFLPLLLGLSVKASIGLLLALHGGVVALALVRRARQRGGLRSLGGLTGVGLVLGLGAAAGLFWVYPHLTRYAHPLAKLVGAPSEAAYYCTRAVECLPRAFLYFVLDQKLLSWSVGLLFRLAALVFLLYVARRAEADRQHRGAAGLLAWAAAFLGLYYLYLHAFSQPWYLLAILPLLPLAPRPLRTVLCAFCLSASSYYVVRMPFNCDSRPLPNVLIEIIEPILVIGPPTWLLLRARRTAAGVLPRGPASEIGAGRRD